MPSTDELIQDFEHYLYLGFSIPNSRRFILRKASGPKQRERLREELDRLIAEKEVGDATVS